jgi:hypothetical protein
LRNVGAKPRKPLVAEARMRRQRSAIEALRQNERWGKV